jgi:hypothetical protein
MDDSTKNLIQSHIDTNEVCLFMKGTPDAPQCGFSMATSNMLKILEVNYKGINVLESQALREGIKNLVTGLLFHKFTSRVNLLVAVTSLKKCMKTVNSRKYLRIKELILKSNLLLIDIVSSSGC